MKNFDKTKLIKGGLFISIFILFLIFVIVLFFRSYDDSQTLPDKDNGNIVDVSTGTIVTLTPTLTDTPEPTVTVVPTSVAPTSTPPAITTLKCTDCTYAPVSKTASLASTYAPSVIATGLEGGGTLTAETVTNLKSMFAAASSEGIPMYIISSYRSYATQQSTFEYWVGVEMANGYSRAQAEARANTYSARPGQSEHQLGTTLDVAHTSCTGDNRFSQSCAGNQSLYTFLKSNAHKYGFVISYPEGKESLTGYQTELWHIRYIGIDLATELYNRNYLSSSTNEYLEKFLIEKNLY